MYSIRVIKCGHRSGGHHGDGVFDEFLGGRILEIGTPWKVDNNFPTRILVTP